MAAERDVRSQRSKHTSIDLPSYFAFELRVRERAGHVVFESLSGFEEGYSVDYEIKRVPLSLLRFTATNPMKSPKL